MICNECKIEKEDSQFYKNPKIRPNGIRQRCRECVLRYRREAHKKDPSIKRRQASNWVIRNREKLKLDARKNRAENRRRYKSYYLKGKFGININQYETMLKEQEGVCKLCGKPEMTKHQGGKLKDLAVDHDHKTGKIRGLLCWVCNTGIGKLQDSPELLRKAADYVEGSS